MILDTFDQANIETGEGFESGEFEVDNTLAMIVLRDKIYVQPKLAMVREVMSNARDANRENKCFRTPIEVELDDSNNTLLIRDSGIGISPERLKFFTTYGGSTKRSSNTQTGGWGLGCKSPFAVSDQFTIKTVWKGSTGRHEATYLMFINASNKSACTCLSQRDVPSTTHTGTEVSIPIPEDEIVEFRRHAESIAQYWDHPLVSNSVRPKFGWLAGRSSHTPVEEGCNYCLGKGIVLDGIHYNFSADKFSEFPADLKVFAKQLCFFFNTGEVDVNPTREDINYTSPRTFEAIYESSHKAKEAIKAAVLAELEDLRDTPLFAALKLHGMTGQHSLVAKEVMAQLLLPDVEAYVRAHTLNVDHFRVVVKNSGTGSPLYNSYKAKNLSSDMRESKLDDTKVMHLAKPDVAFVLQDIHKTRINTYVRGGLEKYSTLVIVPTTADSPTGINNNAFSVVAKLVAELPTLKDIPVIPLSSFPQVKAPKGDNPTRRKTVPKEKLRNMRNGGTVTKRLTSSKRGGVFLISSYAKGYTLNGNRFDENGVDRMAEAHTISSHYDTHNLPSDLPVWGVKPSAFKQLGKGWITPYEFKEIASKRKLNQGALLVKAFETLEFLPKIKTPDQLRVFANKLGPSKMRSFFLRVLDTPFVRLTGRLELATDEEDRFTGDIAPVLDGLLDHYPLLKGLTTYHYTDKVLEKEVITYIRAKKV